MATMWIYRVDDSEVIAEIIGQDDDAIMSVVKERNWAYNDEIGATSSPAFGTSHGLIQRGDREVIEL